MANSKIIHGPPLDAVPGTQSLGQFFFEKAEKYADRICQIDVTTGVKETFASFKKRSVRVALQLRARGVTSDDVVVLCTLNHLDSAVPMLGAYFLGAKVASLDPQLPSQQIGHLLSLVTPKICFVEEHALQSVEEGLAKHAGLKSRVKIVVWGANKSAAGGYETFRDFDRPGDGEDEFVPVAVDAHETATIFFSSGTTGSPKAICTDSYGMIENALRSTQFGFSNKGIIHLSTLYWVSGFFMFCSQFYSGGFRALSPNFDAKSVLETIEKYKVTNIFTSPLFSYKLTELEGAEKYDTSSLQAWLLGGSPLSPLQLDRVRKLLKDSTVLLVYGLTEGGCVAFFGPNKEDKEMAARKPTSVGTPAPGVSIKIADLETDQPLGPNQHGEIRIKSSGVMTGYLHGDSSAAFDQDGYIKTGDVGYYDDDHCLYIVERIKEMLKYQGYQIAPGAIEAVLLEHPDVREAAVFGVADEKTGDLPAACVVLRENSTAQKKDILEYMASKASDHEQLRGGLLIVDAIPKTPSGKVMKKQLKESALKRLCGGSGN